MHLNPGLELGLELVQVVRVLEVGLEVIQQ
jgi:hypothetical protein